MQGRCLILGRSLIFDTGPLISLTVNNLLWVLDGLKKKFKGDFFITPGVYAELIERPFVSKRFKLEALQVLTFITKKTLTLYSDVRVKEETKKLLNLANRCFKSKGSWIRIVHYAEMEVLATALLTGAETVVIDERTTRHLIENPDLIARHISKKTHSDVKINENNLIELRKRLSKLRVIRSIELVTVAYELGLLDKYVLAGEEVIPDLRHEVLEGALWAVKLNGCSVSDNEIKDIVKMER